MKKHAMYTVLVVQSVHLKHDLSAQSKFSSLARLLYYAQFEVCAIVVFSILFHLYFLLLTTHTHKLCNLHTVEKLSIGNPSKFLFLWAVTDRFLDAVFLIEGEQLADR